MVLVSHTKSPLPGAVAVWEASGVVCEEPIFGVVAGMSEWWRPSWKPAGGVPGLSGGALPEGLRACDLWMLQGVRLVRPRRACCRRCEATHALAGVVCAAAAR